MKKLFIISALLPIFWLQDILAQTGWFPLTNGPKSFQFTSVYFINADTGFVAGYDVGNYRTTDGGNSWTFMDNVYGEKFKFFHNNKLGFCYAAGIYQTTDYGFTWVNRNDLPALDIEFPSDSIGYAVGFGDDTSSLLFGKTTDGGVKWTYKNILKQPINNRISNAQAFSFRDEWHGFITFTVEFTGSCSGGSAEGGYYTSDGGNTWINRGGAAIQKLFLHDSTFLSTPYNSPSIEKTYNDFLTERQVSLNEIPKHAPCTPGYNLAMSDTNNISCLSLANGAIFRSTDAGETWYLQLCSIGTGDSPGGISTPTKFVGYAVGLGNQIYKTIDGGGPPFTSKVEISKENNSFSLLSNPITTSADFQFSPLQEPETFALFDLLGRELLRREASMGEASLHLDMQQYPAGVYLARLGGETIRFAKM